MADGIICQCCGVEAPTKFVDFKQNIGALFMRFSKSTAGNLCKRCVHKTFWEYTLITSAVGWLGLVSLFVAPVFVIGNIACYLGTLRMKPVPEGAIPPLLTEDAIARIRGSSNELIRHVAAGVPLMEVATSVARVANVTPGQVLLFVYMMQRQEQTPRTQTSPPNAPL
jgi:hypothetical protein